MQFIDLNAQYKALSKEINNQINDVLNSGKFILGPQVGELETLLKQYVGAKHCITCGNGTDALQILFMAYNIGQGDAVFCPDVTFVSSVEPAFMLGATPVFCDIDASSYNLSAISLEKQIQAVIFEGKLKPKAVVAVDFLGNPADYLAISAICEKYNLILIEDAAQSFGAQINGEKACSFGHASITSFFPAKPLGCYGDGGAIFTNDDNIADVCKSIRMHGKGPKSKYNNIRIGLNSRLDTIQAAILIPKFNAYKEYEIQARQNVADIYNEGFKNDFTIPNINPGYSSVYAQYALLAKDESTREAVIAHLANQNIPYMVYYPIPQHKLPVYKDLSHYDEPFLNANDYCARTFSLPMHPYLDKKEQELIIKTVLEGLK